MSDEYGNLENKKASGFKKFAGNQNVDDLMAGVYDVAETSEDDKDFFASSGGRGGTRRAAKVGYGSVVEDTTSPANYDNANGGQEYAPVDDVVGSKAVNDVTTDNVLETSETVDSGYESASGVDEVSDLIEDSLFDEAAALLGADDSSRVEESSQQLSTDDASVAETPTVTDVPIVAESGDVAVDMFGKPIVVNSEAASPNVVDSPVRAAEPERVAEVPSPPSTNTPEQVNHMSSFSVPHIPSVEEAVAEARKTIATLDAYRALSGEIRTFAAQFILQDPEADFQDEAVAVIGAMRADRLLVEATKAMREAAEQSDRVERVFYILGLPSDVKRQLGSMVATLTNTEMPTTYDTAYDKAVEAGIDAMDKEIVQYVISTQGVLAAANE